MGRKLPYAAIRAAINTAAATSQSARLIPTICLLKVTMTVQRQPYPARAYQSEAA
jgi:hypothetical protein